MKDNDSNSRRAFLKQLGLLLSCQYAIDESVFAAPVKKTMKPAAGKASSATKVPAKPSQHYKIGPWTGDDFTIGHRLRLNDLPKFPDKAEKKVDFIIVGGGVAGLTTAWNLRDHDYLLLEQYDELGGQSRGGSYRGIDYSYGAAYIGPIDDIFGELYSAIGVNPVPLPPDRNAFLWDDKWKVGIEGSNCDAFYKEMKHFTDASKSIWDTIPADMSPDKLQSEGLRKLDQTLMIDCMKGYSKPFISLIDSFCKSALNGGLQQISGLAGYGLLYDLVSTTHVFKGGNPAIAKALSAKLEKAGSGRAVKKAFVWKIEIKDGGASVVYSAGDGSVHRVDCKHVIVATSPLVAARQMVHVPDDLKAGLLSFRFGSYLVANVCMKEKLFKGPYDCFAGTPYTFSDITVAETPYMKTDSYEPNMGSVLTVYQPYSAGTEGRMLLFQGDKVKLASSTTDQIEKLVPGALKVIDEVVLSRWGHALAIINPGYFNKLAKYQNLSNVPYSFAHSSIWGWPAAESAIRGGLLCAKRALKESAGISILVP